MKKIALHWQIIIGLILGLILGFISSFFGFNKFIINYIQPFGTIFINLLKLIAIPLIIVSLIIGISELKDISKLSKMGGRTIGLYLITTVIAISVGLTIVNLLKPGTYISVEKREELKQKYDKNANEKIEIAKKQKDIPILSPLVNIIPTNIFKAFTENKNMLQIVFFALFFGVALLSIPKDKRKPVNLFFEGVNCAILRMIDYIMLYAPFGVLALMAGMMANFAGDNPKSALELLKGLGMYSITVIITLFVLILLVYPFLLKIFSKIKLLHFFKSILPAQILAFSTSSSAATLPLTKDRCEKALGISHEVTSFVLPIGVTVNMDGTSAYQAVATVFIAQAFGIELDFVQQLTIVVTATLSSIGAAGVPGAGMIMLVIVLQSVGLDPAGIALIVAVDRILDMFRTVVNVTGDSTVAYIINKKN